MTTKPAALFLRLIFIFALLAVASGCATTTGGAEEGDPLEGMNRTFYKVNDTLDRNIVKPVAEGYVKVTPVPVRTGVTNFFDNITYLNVIFNDLLQGKFLQGLQDSGRFVVNSSIGVLGLFDVATSMGLEDNSEDLGQTLGVWGAGEGAYLVIPLRGPNSVRDAPDLIVSSFLNPLFYVTSTITIPLGLLDAVNTRANLLDASRIVDEAALDPYIFVREAYRQARINEIYDGNPPSEGLEDFIDDLDDFEDYDEDAELDNDNGKLRVE